MAVQWDNSGPPPCSVMPQQECVASVHPVKPTEGRGGRPQVRRRPSDHGTLAVWDAGGLVRPLTLLKWQSRRFSWKEMSGKSLSIEERVNTRVTEPVVHWMKAFCICSIFLILRTGWRVAFPTQDWICFITQQWLVPWMSTREHKRNWRTVFVGLC